MSVIVVNKNIKIKTFPSNVFVHDVQVKEKDCLQINP